MTLQYVPDINDDVEFERPSAGTYEFVIDDCFATIFKTGNHGMKLELSVFVGDKPNKYRCFDNIVFTPNAKWKMKQLCLCVGVTPRAGMEAAEFVGLVGSAIFVLNEEGYLRVKKFIRAQPTQDPVVVEIATEVTAPKTKETESDQADGYMTASDVQGSKPVVF